MFFPWRSTTDVIKRFLKISLGGDKLRKCSSRYSRLAQSLDGNIKWHAPVVRDKLYEFMLLLFCHLFFIPFTRNTFIRIDYSPTALMCISTKPIELLVSSKRMISTSLKPNRLLTVCIWITTQTTCFLTHFVYSSMVESLSKPVTKSFWWQQ